MIPRGELTTDTTVSEVKMTSRTYRWDRKTNRIQGFIDGLEAVEQTIYKILNTERYEYLIYSFFYGFEIEDLIGQDITYIKADLKRRVEEALTQDDRIERIENFSINLGVEKDQLMVSFDAITASGILNIEKGVNV